MSAAVCAFCGKPKTVEAETWRQWQRAACSSWNDKEIGALLHGTERAAPIMLGPKMTFEEWRATGRYMSDGADHDCHWCGPVYAYDGGFIGIDLLGGLTVPICNIEFHFYSVAEAERCLWEEWCKDEIGVAA